MVYRIYVEKKKGLDHKANALCKDLKESLMIKGLKRVRIFNRYDLDRISEDTFKEAVKKVLSEPQLDWVYEELPGEGVSFAVEYLPGQYDQRADSASQCIQILSMQERPLVKTAVVYMLYGEISEDELAQIKRYLINPVEAREASMQMHESLHTTFDVPSTVEILDGFIDLDEAGREAFLTEHGLAMDMDDLVFCQAYFQSEKRNPSITEIKMIDTYWSDHCRHTTFSTHITKAEFEDATLRTSWERYLRLREELGRTKETNLMDLATIAVRKLKKDGLLARLDESEEINACTVKITVDVDGKDEEWLLLFKNETHNHPTEIEPFGGAATCIGGAIRDPLSGRSYVYAAMRVTGAADPTVPLSKTLAGKLSQRKIVTTAANGYSSYGNQIGLATGLVDEIYHPGYVAKRMEIGAVIAAAPARNVRREVPAAGDLVVLLGGRTGRDGCGGATGSSKAHKLESLEECGAEVQKGNAPEERKLQRLFRNPMATRMIKRCNDFGAGGVSVAIGELANGLDINLDQVPKKYEGLDGTELAISESQERMAVVIEPQNLDEFLKLAHNENLEATQVAVVTDTNRLRMKWNGVWIVDLSRDFLNSNGATKHIAARCTKAEEFARDVDLAGLDEDVKGEYEAEDGLAASREDSFLVRFLALAGDLNVCSKRGLSEQFDSTIGAGTVLMPFGGKYQRTPIQSMVQKISLEHGSTNTVSLMAYGYNPYIMEKDPYKGAYLAVVESYSKLIATGATPKEVYLSFQEYFERLGKDEERWGKPLSALLGALDAQLDLGVAAIGGKDSMSGSFEDLDVPPTLVSFAVTTDLIDRIISPEYKEAGNVVLGFFPKTKDGLPKADALKALYRFIAKNGSYFASLYTPTYGGIAEAVLKQAMGNGFGFCFANDMSMGDVFGYRYGAFLAEVSKEISDAVILRGKEEMERLGIRVQVVGEITKDRVFTHQNSKVDASALNALYENRLEKVFSCNLELLGEDGMKSFGDDSAGRDDAMEGRNDAGKCNSDTSAFGNGNDADSIEKFSVPASPFAKPSIRVAKPKILIPVFPGTNCEYDSARAAKRAGLSPEIVVIKNLSAQDISESVDYMAKQISDSQMIFIPGGFSGGDEPDGSAKFITSFFRNPKITEEVEKLLHARDGLMAGICNGFQALVKLGLLPFGKIMDTDASFPSVTFNTIGRHQSKIVYTRIASNNGPWLSHAKVGDVIAVPISHGEGRFIWDEKKALELAKNGQVATQYVDLGGNPTMDIQYNPNSSLFAIEGLTSKDGRIFGKMGHSERIDAGTYQNVPGEYDIRMFEGAKEYFE